MICGKIIFTVVVRTVVTIITIVDIVNTEITIVIVIFVAFITTETNNYDKLTYACSINLKCLKQFNNFSFGVKTGQIVGRES